ncbi:MAG TPA: HypC/HybG/HupF family hydrogenase formation chaperone [Acidimicrobiales bacterium]|nr:HypC/HybG/HupF family hydrogenase formation chaperone [Acidimicrobiales bacterium]
MCLGIPGLVTELDNNDGQYAWVDVGGARRRVNVALVTDCTLRPGDWVLIHVGFALARIDEAEAHATLRMLEGMEKAYLDELQAMADSAAATASAGSVSGPASYDGRATSNGSS